MPRGRAGNDANGSAVSAPNLRNTLLICPTPDHFPLVRIHPRRIGQVLATPTPQLSLRQNTRLLFRPQMQTNHGRARLAFVVLDQRTRNVCPSPRPHLRNTWSPSMPTGRKYSDGSRPSKRGSIKRHQPSKRTKHHHCPSQLHPVGGFVEPIWPSRTDRSSRPTCTAPALSRPGSRCP
jgi:hypothetical protein